VNKEDVDNSEIPSLDEIKGERDRLIKDHDKKGVTIMVVLIVILALVGIVLACLLTGRLDSTGIARFLGM
jgi:hypothetical protein